MASEQHSIQPQGATLGQKIDGSRIRRLREEKGLTQLYVATVVGVTTDTISRWEHRRYPSIKPENAAKLAEALGVPLAEILDQQEAQPDQGGPVVEAVPDQTAPTPPPGSRPRGWRLGFGLALFLVITIGAVFLAWWFNSRPPLRAIAIRILPPHAPIGLPFPVAITVTPATGEAVPLIIGETMAQQCSAMDGVPPFNAANAATRTFKWIAKPDGPTTFYYMAMVKPHTPISPRIPFRGEITLHRDNGAMTPTGGDDSIAVAPYHWADTNRDFTIDDGEILAVYDTFGSAAGLNLEPSMLEDIWSGHGYRWDETRRQLVVIP